MRKLWRVFGWLACLTAGGAGAQGALPSQVREHRLKNGMVWLLIERPQAPVFTAYVRVKVGGLDEEPGYTGLAHLFEHMAFKGTPTLGTRDFEAEKKLLVQIAEVGDALSGQERAGKGLTDAATALRTRLQTLNAQHAQLTDENALLTLFQLNGANGLNATTNKDLTSYFVSLPRNRLELWALVEASRLASPVLRDFYKERDVVMEERRMRLDSSPDGTMFEELNQAAFTMSPYRWPTVGYLGDLEAMTVQKAHRFHARHYVPANAVGCLVGDFKASEAAVVLDRTFGAIPYGAPPEPPVFAEGPKRAARRSTVYFDASPRWAVAFRKPTLPSRDDTVFDVIEVLLGQGRTGRLHRRLVLKNRLAQGVGVFGSPGSRLENLFAVSASPLDGVAPGAVEKAVWQELEQLKREPVPEQELQKVRNRIQADLARALDGNEGLAGTLSYFQALTGDWRYVVEQPKQVASVTPAEIQRVAQTYFIPENSTTVELQKPLASAAAKRVGR